MNTTYSDYRPPPVGARSSPYNGPSLGGVQQAYDTRNFSDPSNRGPSPREHMGSTIRGDTPSPTPSEQASLKQTSPFPIMDKVKEIRAKPRILLERRSIMWIIIIIFSIVLGALFYFYHTQIVHAIQPSATKLKNLPGGWAIIIAIFFVISFPPLFGHEILAIVCGLVYGIWVGFAIVSAGTLIGELANFYTFKYMCHARAEKWERERIYYGCIAKLVRDGGFKIALIARYSAVPGHFTTAVFATVGMSVWVFLTAAILSLPKQFITVLIGTLMEANNPSTGDRIASDIVGVITALITVAAMWYLNKEVNRVKPDVIHKRRQYRRDKLGASGSSQFSRSNLYHTGGLESTADFNGFPAVPEHADQSVPLTSSFEQSNEFQQWDTQGRAVGYTGDPRLNTPTVHAPQPQRPVQSFPPSSSANSGLGVSTSAGPPGPGSRQDLERQQSGDTVRWESNVNPEVQGNIRLSTMSQAPPLHNPFDDDAATAAHYAAPPGPPPPGSGAPAAASYMSSPTTYAAPPPFASPPPSSPRGGGTPKPGKAGYGFAAPQHSFGSGPSGASSPKLPKQAFSPPPGPPPGYPEKGGIQ